jgi:hypothetical protein
VRAIADDLAIAVVAAPDHLTRDVDTWEDLNEARARADRAQQADPAHGAAPHHPRPEESS